MSINVKHRKRRTRFRAKVFSISKVILEIIERWNEKKNIIKFCTMFNKIGPAGYDEMSC